MSRGKKLTQEEVIRRFNEKHGVGRYDYSKVVFNRTDYKVIIICPINNHGEFPQVVNGHLRGKGCPTCWVENENRLTLEEAKSKYQNENREILDIKSVVCGNKNKKATSIKYRCLIDGYEDWQLLSNMIAGVGCKQCGGTAIHDGNRLSIVRPDLVKYLAKEEDGYNYTIGSSKKINVKCPECKSEKPLSVYSLSSQGFSCSICSDGISRGERFMSEILKDLNVDFTPQKTFGWSGLKRYDFWIPFINCIIEINGIQHTTGWSNNKDDLEKQIMNDKNKKEMAMNNKIENYIVIDCPSSDFSILTEKYTNALSNYYDLSSLNFIDIISRCQRSKVIEVCEYWMIRDKKIENTDSVSKRFKLSRPTIASYLKIGATIGLCNYDPKEENAKGLLKATSTIREKSFSIFQYTMSGEFIRMWNSRHEIYSELGFSKSAIWKCVSGTNISANGFKWSYDNIDNFKMKTHTYTNKTVYQYDKDYKFIKMWDSVTEAINETGVKNISNVALGKVKSGLAGGFRWYYEEEHNEGNEQTPIK